MTWLKLWAVVLIEVATINRDSFAMSLLATVSTGWKMINSETPAIALPSRRASAFADMWTAEVANGVGEALSEEEEDEDMVHKRKEREECFQWP
jgi:hypothetical protein